MINKLLKTVGQWLAAYGKVRQNRNITEMFAANQVLSELNYYYAGSDVQPTGILALEPTQPLRSEFWKPVDLTPALLEKWVKWMQSDATAPYPPCGWQVFDRNNELVGILYAREKVVVKFEKDGRVCVYPPDDYQDEKP